MIELRKDRDLLIQATECLRDCCSIPDMDTWLSRPLNVMLIKGDNVGMASYQYDGVYVVHWYFQSARGREAINLGKEMCQALFDECGAKTLIGLIKKHLKASRWACRQLGFKSQGFITYEDGDENEILSMVKEQK